MFVINKIYIWVIMSHIFFYFYFFAWYLRSKMWVRPIYKMKNLAYWTARAVTHWLKAITKHMFGTFNIWWKLIFIISISFYLIYSCIYIFYTTHSISPVYFSLGHSCSSCTFYCLSQDTFEHHIYKQSLNSISIMHVCLSWCAS